MPTATTCSISPSRSSFERVLYLYATTRVIQVRITQQQKPRFPSGHCQLAVNCEGVSMSKWKGSYESGRTYHVEWEKEFPWVSKAKDGTQQAYCKLCHKGLQPRKGTLKNHAESKEHAQRASSLSSSSTSSSMFQSFKKTSVDSDKLKRAELQLAVGITCHCPVIAVDHLSEIIKLNGGGEHSREPEATPYKMFQTNYPSNFSCS